VSDVVMHAELSVEQAGMGLNRLVDGLRVSMNVRESGFIDREFAELKAKELRGD